MARSQRKEAESAPETPRPSFEAALGELQQIVRQLEDGSLGLEESLSRFEQGVTLLRTCYQALEHAEQRIEILTGFDSAGNPLTAPFDATATAEKTGTQAGRRSAPAATRPTPSTSPGSSSAPPASDANPGEGKTDGTDPCESETADPRKRLF